MLRRPSASPAAARVGHRIRQRSQGRQIEQAGQWVGDGDMLQVAVEHVDRG
ncbi:hypothetical protein ACSDR0_44615 [Streptosporangium sp. G11]|uniref:hypothetical protein n=1 Tax=Streptosporangium sp. G11 TaxID=3436926 RepID=UPI003EB6F6B7